MASGSYPGSSIGILCLPEQQLHTCPLSSASIQLPALTLSVSKPSGCRRHLPAEFYLRCGFVSRPLTSEGLRFCPAHTFWGRVSPSNGGAGRTQDPPRDCAASDAQRLRLGATPPRKKLP